MNRLVVVVGVLAVPATTHADLFAVIAAPRPAAVSVHPTLVVAPVRDPDPPSPFPSIEGLMIGYRGDQLGDRFINGVTFHVIWGRPSSGLEVEWIPSFGHGTRDDVGESFGQFSAALGVRYVVNKHGWLRPYVMLAPVITVLSITDASGNHTPSTVGGQAGIGLDVELHRPGTLSFELSAARGVDVDTGLVGGWDVFATASIGLYFPDL